MRRYRFRAGLFAIAFIAASIGFVAGLLHAGHTPRDLLVAVGVDGLVVDAAEPPQTSPNLEPPSQPGTAQILLVGDVLPLEDRDYFSSARSLIRSADIAICNLECPISSHGLATPMKLTDGGRVRHNEYLFRAPPPQAQRLADAGFDGITLANNHLMDFGGEALLETLHLLDEAGIRHTGAGPDLAAAREPMTFDVDGQIIAVMARVKASTLPAAGDFAATDQTAGTVFAHCDDTGRPDRESAAELRADIADACRQADVVIASFHWGEEAAENPTPEQRNLAHLAVDAGADIVIGHHPHVLQGVEIYRGHPIVYSLGNFAFPTPWESNHFSAAFELRVSAGECTELVFHPIRLRFNAGDPALAQRADAERILDRLTRLSEGLGTQCRRIDGSPPGLRIEGSRKAADEPEPAVSCAIDPHPDLSGMATVRFPAWDFEDGQKVTRQRMVVVAEDLADEVVEIFREIYRANERFPIHEVIGYNYRTVAGSEDRLSFHALGRAIDINRAENPMIMDGRKIVHLDEPPYEPGRWRPSEDRYSIPPDGSVVRAFTSRGWRWGGTWRSCKDYQHFDNPP